MRPVKHETKNLFATFVVRSECLWRGGAFLIGTALAVLFALSTPSAQAEVEKITIAAIDDVVAGDEGWIIAIDDVAADAGGWITAIGEAAGAGGGIAAYAAGAGGGFAAFGDIASGFGGEIASFGRVEQEIAALVDGKILTDKPDERTAEFPSSENTPTITNDPIEETGVISFAKITNSFVEGDKAATIEFLLSKPAPKGGLRLSFTIDGTAHVHEDVEFESSSVFVSEGAIKGIIPIRILEDADVENEILILSWYNNGDLPKGWEVKEDDEYALTIMDNDAPGSFEYPEDETPVVDKPDEDTAIDDTAIYPNGEPPSSENTPTITNDLSEETGFISFAERQTTWVVEEEYETATVEIQLSKPAPKGGLVVNISFSGLTSHRHREIFVPEGESVYTLPIYIPHINREILFIYFNDNNLPDGWEAEGFTDLIIDYKNFENRAEITKTNEESIIKRTSKNYNIGIIISRSKISDSIFEDNVITSLRGRGNDITIETKTNDLFEDYEMIKGVDIAIQAIHRGKWGRIKIANNSKISDVRQGIYAEMERSYGNIEIYNYEEIWGVREYGIYAYHKSNGKIKVVIGEDIKRIIPEGDRDYSDVYMRGGIKHHLRLEPGIILDNVTFGLDDDGRIESWWDVDSGVTQTKSFDGFVDNGAYRYVLKHFVDEDTNNWFYYWTITPTAKLLAKQVKDLTNIKVDGTPVDNFGFYVHQNSLRSSDDSVHFGFNTPVMSFVGGDLSINNNIAPNLSASLVEGMSISNSIELDYHLDIKGFSISPQMELAWTRFDFDDFMGPGSTGKVSLEDGDIITGRLGLLFEGDYIYGGMNLHTPIDGTTSVNVSGVSITNEQDDFSVDGLLGFSYDWSEDYETYGELFMDADEVRANLGVRIDF